MASLLAMTMAGVLAMTMAGLVAMTMAGLVATRYDDGWSGPYSLRRWLLNSLRRWLVWKMADVAPGHSSVHHPKRVSPH